MDEHMALGPIVSCVHPLMNAMDKLTYRDASCGHLLFAINDGRVSAETHSQGELPEVSRREHGDKLT